ncbi:outer membrane beta-barrel protein [Paeniroseomonas aquatica]|uniref:Outer membrane beta-barrel protein n=1 Tax=Paeniroseomonas aquatica TaxID=373043 RepID=A0ABT8A6J6_9PROT|nr:outer membrane beta-barrel protein [Paeniroseomonas aquatica]MDN3565241.1 outer membrane beta-barrel protein [Paeniroseomonas aquatica]
MFWGLTLAAMPLGEAYAQIGAASDTARGVTVQSRARPDYDPLGVRLGGYRLDGAVEIAPGWDSNLFGRKNNVVSDGFVDERANVDLRTDWTTHALGASVTSDNRQYFSRSALNYNDWTIGGFGKYDFNATTNVTAQYRHYREHLDVYNFDVQRAGITQPVPYNSDEVAVLGQTAFNRLGLQALGVYRSFQFEDATVGGVQNQLSAQSFNTVIGSLGGSYSLAPGRAVNAVFRVQDISYSDALTRGRDSFTWEALGGFQYDFDGVWQARVAVGWRQREYRAANIKTLQGPAVEAVLTWAPTQLTTLRFNVNRTIEESIRADAVSFQRTQAGIGVDHEYLRNIILGADLRADRREYESPNQQVTDALATVSARYLLNRNMQLIGTYTYVRRIETSAGLDEYSRNLVQLRLRFAL